MVRFIPNLRMEFHDTDVGKFGTSREVCHSDIMTSPHYSDVIMGVSNHQLRIWDTNNSTMSIDLFHNNFSPSG